MVVAAAAWRNLPNRVPVLAKPHDGSSMRNRSSDSATRVEARVSTAARYRAEATGSRTPNEYNVPSYVPR